MKLSKITLLLSAITSIALSSSLTVLANTATTEENSNLALDSSLEFFYKAQYRNVSDKTGSSDVDKKIKVDKKEDERGDFSHGAGFKFDTGYINDYLGADFAVTFVNPLYVKKDTKAVHAPTKKNSTGDYDGGETIAKIQQVYLKGRHSYNDIEIKGGYGVTQRDLLTFKDSTSKILAASSLGYDFSVNAEDLTVYFTSILGGSDNQSSEFINRIQKKAKDSASGFKIDTGLYIGGLSYELDGLAIAAELGQSKIKGTPNSSGDDEKITNTRFIFKAGYDLALDNEMTLALGAIYGHNKHKVEGTNLFNDVFNNKPEPDSKSQFYNLNATLHYDSAFVTLGYSKVKDGYYLDNYMMPAITNADRFECSLNLHKNFCFKNEQAFLIKAGYDFTAVGVDGFKAAAWFAKGSDAKIGDQALKDFSRKELGLELCYEFQEDLKGLKLAYKYVNYRASADKNALTNHVKGTSAFENHFKNIDEHRLTLSYAYDIWK